MSAPAKVIESLGLDRLSQGESSFIFMLLTLLEANAPGATFANPAREVLHLLRGFAGVPAYQRLQLALNTISENYERKPS